MSTKRYMERLIDVVRDHPGLCDRSPLVHKDVQWTSNTWKKVARRFICGSNWWQVLNTLSCLKKDNFVQFSWQCLHCLTTLKVFNRVKVRKKRELQFTFIYGLYTQRATLARSGGTREMLTRKTRNLWRGERADLQLPKMQFYDQMSFSDPCIVDIKAYACSDLLFGKRD